MLIEQGQLKSQQKKKKCNSVGEILPGFVSEVSL